MQFWWHGLELDAMKRLQNNKMKQPFFMLVIVLIIFHGILVVLLIDFAVIYSRINEYMVFAQWPVIPLIDFAVISLSTNE